MWLSGKMSETQEPWVQSLGQEDSLEEEMAAYSSILACRIPWTEAPEELWDGPWDHKRSDTTEQLRTQILTCQHRPLFPLLEKKWKRNTCLRTEILTSGQSHQLA